jgi:Kef-type K+ transport system membrane component KefB
VSGFALLRHDDFTFTLLGVGVVLITATLAGKLFQRIGQPPVIGEVVAGICLGPSVLGGASAALFPLENRPLLKMLSTVGLVVFMFLIGLDLDLEELGHGRHRVAAGVAVAGTVIPFGLGVLLAIGLHPSHHLVGFWPFALFLGAAMSITAFPVLARILIERDLYSTPLGVVSMACAAGDDVLTWATLALVVAIVSASGAWQLPYIVATSLVFAVVMIRVVRPWLRRFADRELTATGLTMVVVGITLCSYLTSALGVHEIFGAFLLGAVFPRGGLARQVADRLGAVAVILLPMFFVATGLNVDVAAVGMAAAWQFPLILLVACVGKFGGAMVGARAYGLPGRESLALGALMNTRGLTELVVLNIGLQLGVLDPGLFTLLVLMAVVTTMATGPLLGLIRPDPWLGASSERGGDPMARLVGP